ARRYSLAEAYPSWAIWASTNAFISSGTEIFMVVIRYPPFEPIVPSLADFAKRGGNRDAVSIDSNPLRRLRGKLIASRFPSLRSFSTWREKELGRGHVGQNYCEFSCPLRGKAL